MEKDLKVKMKKLDKKLKALQEKEAKINSESLKTERFQLFNSNNREKHVVDQEKEVDTSRMVSSISLGPTTSDCTTLDPTSIGCLEDIDVLETRNKYPEENFFHRNHAEPFETGNENPEEDLSHLSAEEQAVMSNILKIIKGTLSKCYFSILMQDSTPSYLVYLLISVFLCVFIP